MRFRARMIGKGALALIAIALLGLLVKVLWNAVVPSLFDSAHLIDFPHALGLLVLSRLLFGGFRGRGGFGHRRWDRFAAMSAEERARFKGFGRCGSPVEAQGPQ
jgi:hypothetical protein